MSQTQKAGSDGTIEVAIMETGLGISVQQTWAGGDGSMTVQSFSQPFRTMTSETLISYHPRESAITPGLSVRTAAVIPLHKN